MIKISVNQLALKASTKQNAKSFIILLTRALKPNLIQTF